MSISRFVALMLLAAPAAAQQPQIITGLKQPESVAVGPDGKVYVGETGEYEKANDGYISVLEGGKLRRFASGLDDPHGIKWYRSHLFVSDNMGMVWRIDGRGNVERFVDATDFPRKITNFNDLEIDGEGNLYLSDSGDWDGGGGAIYRITQEKKVIPVITQDDDVRIVSPNGLLLDGDRLLEVDYTTGILFRVDLKDKVLEKVTGGLGASDGLVRDGSGRLLVTDFAGHRVFVLTKDAKPMEKPQEIAVSGIESAADLTVSPDGKSLLIPDMSGGKLAIIPIPK